MTDIPDAPLAPRSYLIDTNVLIDLVNQDSPRHVTVGRCLTLLWDQGTDLTYTSQNLAEFWCVCTRPSDRNGFGLSVAETDKRALLIETRLRFIEDSSAIHSEWRKLVVNAGVSGAHVHDARLAAAMKVHRTGAVVTYNLRDFRRFEGLVALSPPDILRASGVEI